MANETMIRAGISRAYYAAYHVCLEASQCYTNMPFEEGEKGNSHERVYKLLENNVKDKEFQEALSYLAAQARKIKTFRIKADYRLINYTGTNKDLLGCISYLNALIKEYESLDAG
jgi:hypothetical protein